MKDQKAENLTKDLTHHGHGRQVGNASSTLQKLKLEKSR